MMRLPLAPVLAWSLATVLVAGVVHLSSILLLPSVALQDSHARLSSLAQGAGFHVASSPDGSAAPLPFVDPGTLLAVCHYDLETGAWRVRVAVDNEALTSLSFHARSGTVFHTLTDRAALRGRLDVLLGTAVQVDAAEAADTDETGSREVRLTSPSRTGMVIMRAMPPTAEGMAALRRRLEAAECRTGS